MVDQFGQIVGSFEGQADVLGALKDDPRYVIAVLATIAQQVKNVPEQQLARWARMKFSEFSAELRAAEQQSGSRSRTLSSYRAISGMAVEQVPLKMGVLHPTGCLFRLRAQISAALRRGRHTQAYESCRALSAAATEDDPRP
jgi:hypothetical protein